MSWSKRDKMIDCDVLVVGAGPAGCSAARAAALGGLGTILIDKRKDIDSSSSFAGAVGSYLFPFLPIKIPEEMLTWKIDELQFNSHGIVVNRKGGPWTSYAIDRSEFDSWLVDIAVEAGAKLHLGTQLIDIEFSNHSVTEVLLETKNGEETIKPKVVIAADGVNSTVLEKLGVRGENLIIGSGISYEFENVDLAYPHADQLFFGDFVPGGYAYVFPLSLNRANVGVGSIVSKDIEQCLKEFIALPAVKEQIKNARKVNEKRGQVPFSHPSKRCRYGNVLFAGDAAAQNIKPLIEGFLPAIICGDIAGAAAAGHLNDGKPLESYEKNIEKKLGLLFRESDRYIDVMEEFSHSTKEERHLLMMGLCSNVFSIGDIGKLKTENHDTLKQRLNDWRNSKTRQFMTNFSERAGIGYLRLMSK
jgi:digeranylgeranylglycerophospholipid reductase